MQKYPELDHLSKEIILRIRLSEFTDISGDFLEFCISTKRKIPDSKARLQIPFGIPNNLYEIPAGVGPLAVSYVLSDIKSPRS